MAERTYRVVDTRCLDDFHDGEREDGRPGLSVNAERVWLRLLVSRATTPVPGLVLVTKGELIDRLRMSRTTFERAFQELADDGKVEADWKVGVVVLPNAPQQAVHAPGSTAEVVAWSRFFANRVPRCPLTARHREAWRAALTALGPAWIEAFDTESRPPRKGSGAAATPGRTAEPSKPAAIGHAPAAGPAPAPAAAPSPVPGPAPPAATTPASWRASLEQRWIDFAAAGKSDPLERGVGVGQGSAGLGRLADQCEMVAAECRIAPLEVFELAVGKGWPAYRAQRSPGQVPANTPDKLLERWAAVWAIATGKPQRASPRAPSGHGGGSTTAIDALVTQGRVNDRWARHADGAEPNEAQERGKP